MESNSPTPAITHTPPRTAEEQAGGEEVDSQSEEAGTSLAPPNAQPGTPGPQSPDSSASSDPSSTGLASEVAGPTAGPSNALPTVPVNGKKMKLM